MQAFPGPRRGLSLSSVDMWLALRFLALAAGCFWWLVVEGVPTGGVWGVLLVGCSGCESRRMVLCGLVVISSDL